MAGQTQSKWLREENDDTWEARIGRANNQQYDQGGKIQKMEKR